MKKQKNTNLVFTINVKDFDSDNDVIDYLIEAVQTSLQLNRNEKFLKDMEEADDISLSMKKNLKIKIKDCSCN